MSPASPQKMALRRARALTGAGLGFRREMLGDLDQGVPAEISFFEIAPENWMGKGGRYAAILHRYTEQHRFVCHGLSLSLGGSEPLDVDFVRRTGLFMREHGIELFTDHLSWCADDGHLYELLPLPLTMEAARHVASRVMQVQDILQQRIGIENPSYYLSPPGAEMDEAQFIRTIVQEADCGLHLDVNNIHVNSRNHGFDAADFMAQLPLDRVLYIHVAGHEIEPDGLLLDTHGADVIDPVWTLLAQAYAHCGPVPTCLERDFNIPPLATLMPEVRRVASMQDAAAAVAESSTRLVA
jgi:uncharacterized protein (UPF0276 family)